MSKSRKIVLIFGALVIAIAVIVNRYILVNDILFGGMMGLGIGLCGTSYFGISRKRPSDM